MFFALNTFLPTLDDLSSGSEEAFFDVQPLPGFCIPGRPQINLPGIQAPIVSGSLVGSSWGRTPSHSQSLPAINKLHPSSKMGNAQPGTTDAPQEDHKTPPSPSQQLQTFSPQPVFLSTTAGIKLSASKTSLDMNRMKSHNKKYAAPQPPVSRKQSFKSTVSRTPRSSLDDSILNLSLDYYSLAPDDSPVTKKVHRNTYFKKYRAPPPPTKPATEAATSSYENAETVINGTEDESSSTYSKLPGSPVPRRTALLTVKMKNDQNFVSHSVADVFSESMKNKERTERTEDKSPKTIIKKTMGLGKESPAGSYVNTTTNSITNPHSPDEEMTKGNGLQVIGYVNEKINKVEIVNETWNDLEADSNQTTAENPTVKQEEAEALKERDGAYKCNVNGEKALPVDGKSNPGSESGNYGGVRQSEIDSSNKKKTNTTSKTASDSLEKGGSAEGKSRLTETGISSETEKKKREVSSGKPDSATKDGDDDKSSKIPSSRVVSPDPGQKIGFKRSVSGKLSSLTNKFEAEDNKGLPTEVGKPNPKVGKLTELTNKFGGDKSLVATSIAKGSCADRKGSIGEKSDKMSFNPYSKAFSPETDVVLKGTRKRSIGGIDISKFGSFVKPVDYLNAQKTKKETDILPANKKPTENQTLKGKIEEIAKTTDFNVIVEPIKEESSIIETNIINEVFEVQETVASLSEVPVPEETSILESPVAPSVCNEKTALEITSSEVKENLLAKPEELLKDAANLSQISFSIKNKVTELVPEVNRTSVEPREGHSFKSSINLSKTSLSLSLSLPGNKNSHAAKYETPIPGLSPTPENRIALTNDALTGKEKCVETAEAVDRKDANSSSEVLPENKTSEGMSEAANLTENKDANVTSTVNENNIEAARAANRNETKVLPFSPVLPESQLADVKPSEVNRSKKKVADIVAEVSNTAATTPEAQASKDEDKSRSVLISESSDPTTASTFETLETPDKEVFEDARESLTHYEIDTSANISEVRITIPECDVSENTASLLLSPIPNEFRQISLSDYATTLISAKNAKGVSVVTDSVTLPHSIQPTVETNLPIVSPVEALTDSTVFSAQAEKCFPLGQNDASVDILSQVTSVTNTPTDVISTINTDIPSKDVSDSIPLKTVSDLLSEKSSKEEDTSTPEIISASDKPLQKNPHNEVPLVSQHPLSNQLSSCSANSLFSYKGDISFTTFETIPTTSSDAIHNQIQTVLQKAPDALHTFGLKDPNSASSLKPALPEPPPVVACQLSNKENEIKLPETLQHKTNSSQAEFVKTMDPSYNLPLLRPLSLRVAPFPQARSLSDLGCSEKQGKVETPVPDSTIQLSVRPKIRRRSYETSIPKEVLNISEILRDAEDRLSKALSNKLDPKSDKEIHVDTYDPSQFDILMPLPAADDMNLGERHSRSSTPFRDRFERSPTPKRVVEQTEAMLLETDRILRKTRSQHSLRRSFTRSLSGVNINRLTEVTADLNEEHSTAQLASERIEAEQSERMRLEKEVAQLQMDIKHMTTTNDKLEMEKLRLKNEVLQHAELNGDIDNGTADASLYKRKYEWCLREIEVLKKQLKQQQEDDLDQLLTLKKQLEKKVADSYEETDEQRQVVAQMKKKSQRLQAEMNDMKILLEEQTSRNNLLEKKQRKFDQDMQSVVEEQRNERLAKEKIQREKDHILSEKYSFEQEVATLKLELELKDEKLSTLTRELDDLNFTGKAEEEVALLKKAKHDLELRVKDQEEELDDLAGQVQMLESAKIRLEMSIEQMRKENRKELSQRDEEVEEVRLSTQKKIKALEAQLEGEHEERTQLVREKHELERRLVEAHNRSFATVEEDAFHRVKKELKKTKALLKDTQTMLEKTQSEGSNKLLLRQLKTQLEDAEFAKMAAIKAKQSTESDFSEVQNQLEEAQRARKDAEEKLGRATKEKAEMQTQLEESEEEVAEVIKKYKATVSQLSVDQISISEQAQLIADLEHDKQVLQDKLSELSSKVEVLEGETASIHTQRRLQLKIKELESKLDLESTTRQRLESQISRLKDQVERVSAECDALRLKESHSIEHAKKLSRQLREAKEDVSNLQAKLTDSVSKKQEVEKQYELAESEIMTLKSDLKLAFKRIEDLQQALQGDISDSDTEISDSGSESETSLTSFLTGTSRPDFNPSNMAYRTTSPDSKGDLMGPSVNDLMSVIKEDAEDDYKESFA